MCLHDIVVNLGESSRFARSWSWQGSRARARALDKRAGHLDTQRKRARGSEYRQHVFRQKT